MDYWKINIVHNSSDVPGFEIKASDSHHVTPENGLALHVLEAELADIEATQAGILLRIGWVVPGVQLIAAKQDGLDHVAALSDLTLDTQLLLQEGKTERKIVLLLLLAPTCVI